MAAQTHTITIPQTPGRCRWCRCTYNNPCAEGCAWANREQTLCTACVPLDAALKSAAGRRNLAEFIQGENFDVVRVAKDPRKCIRPECDRKRKSRRHKLCSWHSQAA
ncbi:MAG TPA: hypothetical protein VEU08_17125 [Vicinamibacterales bacterium]|nr:hypothetical protein [Vicinamibacterales bacterium]